MKRADPKTISACQQAFLAAKRHEPLGVWCGQKALTAALTEFCRAHGEILWTVQTPDGVSVLAEYEGCYGATFGQWYAEIEQKSKGWTAYVLDTNVEDADWLPVPGTPFESKEEAAKSAEEYMRNGLADSGVDVVSGPVCRQDSGMTHKEWQEAEKKQAEKFAVMEERGRMEEEAEADHQIGLFESEPELNGSLGGTREYLTRDD